MNDPRAYFPFYPADFWGADAVALMSFEAVGLYLMMLSREWEQGSIAADELFWRSLHGHKCQNWDAAWKQVRPCFEEEAGRLRNKRLEDERSVADGFSSKQSAKAKAKWERWRASKSAAAVPRQSRGNATSMPGQDRTGSDQTGKDRTGSDKTQRAPRVAPAALDLDELVSGSSLDTPMAKAALREWVLYKHERKEAYKPQGIKALLSKLAQWGPQRTEAAIRHSMANNWAGIFEPSGTGAGGRVEPKGAQGLRDYLAKSHGGGA